MTTGSFQAEDGARLTYSDEGAGLPVLALAGFTRTRRDFDYLARHLSGVRLIRLDSRGRGDSEWTGVDTYNVVQEARDALALLDHLGVPRAAVIGTSRGGLLGMVMAATAPERVCGLCLNDVGPVLERPGLERIGTYIGVEPAVSTLEEIADRMPAAMPGFTRVPEMRWEQETIRRYMQTSSGVELPYDPALREAFQKALAAAPADAWPLFDACPHIPIALIRGANSDVLSCGAADAMVCHRPDMSRVDVPNRGHTPFLDEPEALETIQSWLTRCAHEVESHPQPNAAGASA